MTAIAATSNLVPPLGLLWRSDTRLSVAVTGPGTVYGVTPSGAAVALNAETGAVRWSAANGYLPTRLSRQGSRLFAFRMGAGLVYLDDAGTSATERLAISFGLDNTTQTSTPVVDDRMVYLAVNRGLYAVHQDQGLQYATVLPDDGPYGIGLLGSREIVLVSAQGVPTHYRAAQDKFEVIWTGAHHGVATKLMEHPFLIVGSLLIVGVEPDTVAYDLRTGQIAWHLPNVAARTLAVAGNTVYAGFAGASVWALSAADGSKLWYRQYMMDLTVMRDHKLAAANGSVYYGCTLKDQPDSALLLSLNEGDGAFTWVSRGVSNAWAGGYPVIDGDRLYVFGGDHTGAYAPLLTAPLVTPGQLTASPRPLRGQSASFGPGKIGANLQAPARFSIATYRERGGMGSAIVSNADWAGGTHEVAWTPNAANGFTDTLQFGYMLFDVRESSGPRYTQALLMPVNTFPDIIDHWARFNVEVMVYHKLLSGYPDQLFRPDNQVTRAESCTIIAKTLGVEGPSQGFRTAFTDIGNHWARTSIMALEERGIISGFAEPDGTFTFRPDLNMTRAQEARILVRAYAIPSAPPGFHSNFTDTANHWARADIEALEANGYVNGFEEADGTFTYRPENNLSRAEICTMIVRIRGLHK